MHPLPLSSPSLSSSSVLCLLHENSAHGDASPSAAHHLQLSHTNIAEDKTVDNSIGLQGGQNYRDPTHTLTHTHPIRHTHLSPNPGRT